MTAAGPGGTGAGARAYAVIHGALLAGVVMIAGVFAMAATIAPAAPLESVRGTLRRVGFLELAFVIAASAAVRRTLTALPAGADRDAWWKEHGPTAMVLWALAEGTALLGAVFWFLARDVVVFGVLVGAGLIGLVTMAPRRLEER